MTDPRNDDDAPADPPLDPAAAKIVARVRLMMLISAVTTFVAVGAVLSVIGYRVFRAEGSAPSVADVTGLLPKGARIAAVTVVGDRIVVTLDVGGATEIRTYDAITLRPAGVLRFASEP